LRLYIGDTLCIEGCACRETQVFRSFLRLSEIQNNFLRQEILLFKKCQEGWQNLDVEKGIHGPFKANLLLQPYYTGLKKRACPLRSRFARLHLKVRSTNRRLNKTNLVLGFFKRRRGPSRGIIRPLLRGVLEKSF
jgi:hypothetical protein